jgi:hypothetical protein
MSIDQGVQLLIVLYYICIPRNSEVCHPGEGVGSTACNHEGPESDKIGPVTSRVFLNLCFHIDLIHLPRQKVGAFNTLF